MSQSYTIPPDGISRYIKRRGIDLENLQQQLIKKQTPEFFRIGHGLKGNAITFGFPELEKIGIELEAIAESKDWKLAKQTLFKLHQWYVKESKIFR